jgi:glyoxylase-like metal-dependent hydrolase (beta-lactamase superfamily II)
MYMQLEDEFGDVVGKARRGQEKSVREVAEAAGLSPEDVERMEGYELIPGPAQVQRLARFLGLDEVKLLGSAEKGFFPLYPSGRPVEGLTVEMIILGSDFLMNGYVVGCTQTGKGVVIDPGFEAERVLKAVETAGLDIESVLLTHGHGDHTGALSEVCQATDAPAFVNQADLDLMGSLSTKIEGGIEAGDDISVGHQRLRARATPGHTNGGMSLVGDRLVFVGDALFAGSMGGTRSQSDYQRQREAVRSEILALDERVTLYPGHGPATTVAEEKANNPFFADS